MINYNTKVKHLLFNKTDLFNDIYEKIDYIFTTSEEKYNNKTTTLYPGYDPLIFYPILTHDIHLNKKDTDDISIICDNLFEKDMEYSNRMYNKKTIIDIIYNNQDTYVYKFYIYGPEYLNKLYPKSYNGMVSYCDKNKVFNYSKINLITYVIRNTSKYLNDKTIYIMD